MKWATYLKNGLKFVPNICAKYWDYKLVGVKGQSNFKIAGYLWNLFK